jgi:hypothetical protein
MFICYVKPRPELVASRGEAIITAMLDACLADRWGDVDGLVAELGCITGELAQHGLLTGSREARLGGPPLAMLEVLTTNRSSSCVGAPPLDDLVAVTELNRWWCSAVVEPENGPPGFDTSAGAIDPQDYELLEAPIAGADDEPTLP